MERYIYDHTQGDIPRLIERYIQSGHINFLIGSGASRPAINLAGDIENEINTHLQIGDINEANVIALNFIEEVEYQNGFLPTGYTIGDATDITLNQYIEFLRAVDRILFERKNILLPRQANIFTTNYDEFIESAASFLPSTILNDGFERRVGSATFSFSPEILFDRVYRSNTIYTNQSEIPSLNLIKMHGSTSWRRESDDRILFGHHSCHELTAVEKISPSLVSSALSQRAVILPNMRKFESTLLDRVYFDLLRIYSNALDKENSLLIAFGFSFADDHILDITRRALRNPTAQLIILAFDEASANGFEAKFTAHRNVAVVTPSDGNFIDFPAINRIFDSIAPSLESSHA